MSRATVKHFRQSNNCPKCGSAVYENTYGAITEYVCKLVSKGECDWTLDWPTPGTRPGVTRESGIKRKLNSDNYD